MPDDREPPSAGDAVRARGDTPSRALARIVAVADAVDDVHPALAEAISMGGEALLARDGLYERRVLVVGADVVSAASWIAEHARPEGAGCEPVSSPTDVAVALTPATIVLLPGADSRDDWPQLAAEVAVLGDAVDVINFGSGRRG